MEQIISSLSQKHNSHSSDSNRLTTLIHRPTYIDPQLFRSLKAEQHAAANKIAASLNYKPTAKAILSELVNHCDKLGDTRIAQKTIAKALYISVDTIKRYLNIFQKDNLISRKKNGWQVSNTTTLLFIQRLNYHKECNLHHNLTSSSLNYNTKDKTIYRQTNPPNFFKGKYKMKTEDRDPISTMPKISNESAVEEFSPECLAEGALLASMTTVERRKHLLEKYIIPMASPELLAKLNIGDKDEKRINPYKQFSPPNNRAN